jgi:hypothetical protein
LLSILHKVIPNTHAHTITEEGEQLVVAVDAEAPEEEVDAVVVEAEVIVVAVAAEAVSELY